MDEKFYITYRKGKDGFLSECCIMKDDPDDFTPKLVTQTFAVNALGDFIGMLINKYGKVNIEFNKLTDE